jgi:putative NADH-flavin reductase
MKILVLGASGGVGRHVVQQASAAGHDVTALVRAGSTVAGAHGVRVVVDDVCRAGCFDDHVGGHDVVLSSLGFRRKSVKNPWSAITSPPAFNSSTASALVAAMKRHAVPRLIAVSAAGVGDSASRMNALMKFFVATSSVGVAYRDLAVMEEVVGRAGLEGCCVRPTRLTDGPLTKRVQVIEGFPAMAAISRANVAWWMLSHVSGPLPSTTPTITGA